MIYIKDEPFPLRVSRCSLLAAIVFLLMTHCCGGDVQIDPPPLVVAMAGDDAVLPCQLSPPRDASQITIEWGRPDLKPRFVFVHLDGKEHVVDQNTAYKGRASLDVDKMIHGDISLKLSKVKVSDSGKYRCFLPKQKTKYFVDLVVGAASSPVVSLAGTDKDKGGVVLQCESKGWYPEPELLWLDAEGKLLSAGPTETVGGPDVLYTVSSRVTVEKRHSNSFTCRVQQKTINQTRDTHIHVPDDFFVVTSNCTAFIASSVVFCLMLIIAVAFSVWKWRQNKLNQVDKSSVGDKTEHWVLMQSKHEELKMKEEEQRIVEQMKTILKELNDIADKVKDQRKEHMENTESETEQTERNVRLVEEEVEETGDKANGYFKLMGLMTQNNSMDELQLELNINTEKLLERTCSAFQHITDKDGEVKKQIEAIKEQLKDTEKQIH